MDKCRDSSYTTHRVKKVLSLEGARPTLSAARDDVVMSSSGVGKDPGGWEELGAVEWRVLVATGQGLTSAPQHLGEGGKSGGAT